MKLLKRNHLSSLPMKIALLVILGALLIGYILNPNESDNSEDPIITCAFKPTADTPTAISLPIIVIDTLGKEISSNVNVETIMINGFSIDLAEKVPEYQVQISLYDRCNMDPSFLEPAMMRVRGQSSRLFPKKQYSVDFEITEGVDNSISIFGMPAHSKWVLNGAYADQSLIRNYLMYDLGSKMLDYSPRTRFVEVFLKIDNEPLSFERHYIGVYLLTEKIERDKNRVNITKADERYNDISFIIARDKVKLNEQYLDNIWRILDEPFFIESNGNVRLRTVLSITYPSAKKISDEYSNKILAYINDFESALYSSHFKDKQRGYRRYINIDSFVDYAILNEISKNVDGGEVSTYFHKTVGGKLMAGPVWDFDLAMGNSGIVEVDEPTGFRIVNTVWFNRLFQDDYFVAQFTRRYQYYRKTILSDERISQSIDDIVSDLETAASRNEDRWYRDSNTSFKAEIAKLKSFLLARMHWMDANIHSSKRNENTLE